MKALRKSVLVAGAALALSGTALAVTATPATAASTVGGCTTSVRINQAGFNEATALCTQGSGTYRVAAFFPIFSLSNIPLPRTGPVVQVGQPSTVVYGNGSGFLIPLLGGRPAVEILS
jgi:hypothetical protein